MSQNYHFTFSAAVAIPADELLRSSKFVEVGAREMGFDPTLALDASFHTQARQDFARRGIPGHYVEKMKLKGAVLQDETLVWDSGCNLGSGYRKIVKRFAEAGFLEEEKEEFPPIS